jgi:heme exporter protein C
LSVLLIPLVHWSVVIWRSLHQTASVLDTDGDIAMDDMMLFTLFVGVVAFTLLYAWLVIHRTRVMAMEDMVEDSALETALAERRAEGVAR